MSTGGARWFGCLEPIHIEKHEKWERILMVSNAWFWTLPSIPKTEARSFPFMSALVQVAFVSLAAQSPDCFLSSLPV